MQLRFVEQLQPGLADVLRTAVIGLIVGLFDTFDITLVDAADVADDVRSHRTLWIVAQQACLHLDPGEAVALRHDARDLLVAQTAAHRHAFKVAAFLQQLHEAAAVAGLDRHQRRQLIQGGLDVFDLIRCDL